MNEKELGDALLKWAATGSPRPPDAGEMVNRVLTRDRRRVRTLAALTVLLWVVAAAGIPLFFSLFVVFLLPKVDEVFLEMITHHNHTEPQHLAAVTHQLLMAISKLSILLVCGSVLTLLLAAFGTVRLVFASRRATLRQVNANLAAIADQMRKGGGAV